MKVGIYGRAIDKRHYPFIETFIKKLNERGIDLIIHKPFYNYLKPKLSKNFKFSHSLFTRITKINQPDFLFSIGGDGTLLNTLGIVKNLPIPIVGINTGRLGFLSTIYEEEIDHAFSQIFDKKNYYIDERTILEATSNDQVFKKPSYALNEVVVHKKDSSAMITIKAYLDGNFLNTYWADGLIISTPTGSTAYSLSCNGPIVMPRSGNFIITPISPHNLNVRPLIIPDNSILKLTVEGRDSSFLASLDSRSKNIYPTTELTIQKARFSLKLLRLNDHNFFNTLRNKLMWGADIRN